MRTVTPDDFVKLLFLPNKTHDPKGREIHHACTRSDRRVFFANRQEFFGISLCRGFWTWQKMKYQPNDSLTKQGMTFGSRVCVRNYSSRAQCSAHFSQPYNGTCDVIYITSDVSIVCFFSTFLRNFGNLGVLAGTVAPRRDV